MQMFRKVSISERYHYNTDCLNENILLTAARYTQEIIPTHKLEQINLKRYQW